MHSSLLCLSTLTILLYVNCFLFFHLVFCIVCLLYLSISMNICIYIYCCFRYLNGVCPIHDDHRGHHNTSTMYFSLCRHVMTTLRLLHPLSLNSSIVFICDKGLHPAELLLLFLPVILYIVADSQMVFSIR